MKSLEVGADHHIFRGANGCADAMAEIGLQSNEMKLLL